MTKANRCPICGLTCFLRTIKKSGVPIRREYFCADHGKVIVRHPLKPRIDSK